MLNIPVINENIAAKIDTIVKTHPIPRTPSRSPISPRLLIAIIAINKNPEMKNSTIAINTKLMPVNISLFTLSPLHKACKHCHPSDKAKKCNAICCK